MIVSAMATSEILYEHTVFHYFARRAATACIDRIVAIWRECLSTFGGPFLFGETPCMADAMYAPVVTRFMTYDVSLDRTCAAYCKRIIELPAMQEWIKAAKQEPEEIDELDAEF